ncbi:macoilin-2 isoform X3 [Plodia interpunctella]|uniref:macoilin-2 isoform X3 n=1 Tax=Plodia interpunctella TaxID=58824 RepID=UPI002368DC75|nr:macoilin-2 isoform X3 [Plodia interpunctella]
MKRRNAETGKMRRPLKRTKITEGMYGNSMLYLKFVMLWATVVMADYMLEFRFEFLWPFWMMLRSVYDSYKFQGLAFSVFFICIALTSDMICFFFIPLQYIFFAASTYVWVQYVWYTFADKGICLPTVAICCLVVYVEGALRGERASSLELYRPLAAHCVGYPAVSLGFGVKSYVGHRLRLRRQRQVRAENEFYFQLMRDAIPESALEQSPQTSAAAEGEALVRRKCRDANGDATHKLDKCEKHLSAHARDKPALANGSAPGADHEHGKVAGGAKNSKCDKKEASTLREEKKRSKNKDKDKDKDSDSHKSTEQTKEHIVKEVESTKESVKSKECNGYKDDKKERERELKEREREREREREQREVREAREYSEELKRVKAELAAALVREADARLALAAAAAAERQRRADHNHLKQAHAALQHKMSAWRGGERALERRLGEERRARSAAEHQLLRHAHAHAHSGECDNEWCRSRRSALESESSALRRELTRVRDSHQQLQRDLDHAQHQMRSLEALAEESSPTRQSPLRALQERAAHLQRSLSAETRVKLDLLSALGDAKRQLLIQEGVISNKEKEISELKAQLLAVMPAELVSLHAPLDPNASVYTPKQLCSDA